VREAKLSPTSLLPLLCVAWLSPSHDQDLGTRVSQSCSLIPTLQAFYMWIWGLNPAGRWE
jgi:hypothetical protein